MTASEQNNNNNNNNNNTRKGQPSSQVKQDFLNLFAESITYLESKFYFTSLNYCCAFYQDENWARSRFGGWVGNQEIFEHVKFAMPFRHSVEMSVMYFDLLNGEMGLKV